MVGHYRLGLDPSPGRSRLLLFRHFCLQGPDPLLRLSVGLQSDTEGFLRLFPFQLRLILFQDSNSDLVLVLVYLLVQGSVTAGDFEGILQLSSLSPVPALQFKEALDGLSERKNN